MAPWSSSGSDDSSKLHKVRKAQAGLDLSCGQALALSPWPVPLRRLGQGLAGLSLLLGLLWWASLAWGASKHWASWAEVPVAALVLLALVWWPARVLSVLIQPRSDRLSTVWWHQRWPEVDTLGADSPWRNQAGQPVHLSVVFDLGAALVVRTQAEGEPSARLHWLSAKQLAGPWRWRVVRSGTARPLVASSPSSPLPGQPLSSSKSSAQIARPSRPSRRSAGTRGGVA